MSRNNPLPFGLTDQVDSVLVVTDGTGQVETRMEYLPYGETWYQEGDEKNSPKYNSQELDKETRYYYYNARHYDPEIGRFVTADNVIDGEYSTQGWNRYMYCHGNPVKYMDPTGHGLAEWGANLTRKIENYVNGTNYALPYPDEVKKSVESHMDKAKDSNSSMDRTNNREKSPDLVVEISIKGNITDKNGTVIGMQGTQNITYKDSTGKIREESRNVRWIEDNLNEVQDTPYEHPAQAEKFEIVPKPKGSNALYEVQTTHPEGGIAIHQYDPSEGCIIVSEKTEKDIIHRLDRNEKLTGEIRRVNDARNERERKGAPLPPGFKQGQ